MQTSSFAVAEPSLLPDSLQFMKLLWALSHGLDRTSKHMSRRLGVTGPQRFVLRIVGLLPGVSAGELAAMLHIHPSTLTGILQRLMSQQMLIRKHDVNDRRRALLYLTAKGARVNSAASGTVEAAVNRALDEVSPHDRAACRRVIECVTRHLDPDLRRNGRAR